jgi:hypothetical protein
MGVHGHPTSTLGPHSLAVTVAGVLLISLMPLDGELELVAEPPPPQAVLTAASNPTMGRA